MEVIRKDSEWFASEEGIRAYEALASKEERMFYVYSYLYAACQSTMKRSALLFQMAFLLVDAVAESTLPYALYPALIDPSQNPFVAYTVNVKAEADHDTLLCIFLSVLHGTADPIAHAVDLNKMVYSDDFITRVDSTMFDPDAFEIEDGLKQLQLEIIWMWGKDDHE